MDVIEFMEHVDIHSGLRGHGIVDDNLAVTCLSNGLITIIPIEAIEKSDWAVLEKILLCKLDPQVLYHMTRVVGYYSRIENWNSSKIGELKDRKKGNYTWK